MIEIIDISLIGAVRVSLHIPVNIIQDMIYRRIRIFVLHSPGRTQPCIDTAVIFPVPVIHQQDTVPVGPVISELIILIESLRIDSHKFIIVHTGFNFPGILLQRFLQCDQHDITPRLLLPFGDHPAQTFFFLVRQHIAVIKYTLFRGTALIRPLIVEHSGNPPVSHI